jgi:glycerol 3-phosphatase-2
VSAVRESHDALLLDLDGTVYQGEQAVPGAVAALGQGSQRLLYVTNNASRSPHEVAQHLRDLGFTATADDVVTSSQAAARVLARQLPAGSAVLVVGTQALADEVRAVGLIPVSAAADNPAGVVQGHSPDTGWRELAEAALAIRAGAWWVATNLDPTLPTERGLLPGNGSMVAALASATGAHPVVAGKPAPPLLHDAIERAGSVRPLVVGDRLDTDIAGARAVGAPSMLVLTGVSTALDVLRAPEEQRPDLIGADLAALNGPASRSAVGPVAGWSVTVADGHLVLRCADAGMSAEDGLRAACQVAWDNPGFTGIRAHGAGAAAALQAWSAAGP